MSNWVCAGCGTQSYFIDTSVLPPPTDCCDRPRLTTVWGETEGAADAEDLISCLVRDYGGRAVIESAVSPPVIYWAPSPASSVPGYQRTPAAEAAARRGPLAVKGSETSEAAAAAIAPATSRLCQQVLVALRRRDADFQTPRDPGYLERGGLTDDEGAAALRMGQNTYRPRRRELQQRGLVRISGCKRPTASGAMAQVWTTLQCRPTEEAVPKDEIEEFARRLAALPVAGRASAIEAALRAESRVMLAGVVEDMRRQSCRCALHRIYAGRVR